MKKRSILLIFSAALLVFSFIQYRLDVRSANLKGFEIQLVERERSIRLVSALTESLIVTDRRDVIEGHLQDAVRVGWIDFYMLTFDGNVVMFDSLRPLSDDAYGTLMQTHPPDTFWEFHSAHESVSSIRGPASKAVSGIEDFRFFEADLGGSRRLKLGFNSNREAFLAEMEVARAGENHRIFVLSLIIAFGVFLFSARDLLLVTKIIRTKGVRGLRELRVFSKEAAVLQQGLTGFGETVHRLTKENKALEAQVLPSLRSEIHSGKKPPYDFNCTMVRTDINNFTQIFHAHPADVFLATINEFFTECSHIISRYDGFIHEFVGDEIIYYFKDEQHANSFTAALACAREIEAVAESIHARTQKERGYAFRIKSSLAYGKIRFGALLNGFSLAGSPLIETTRILSAVSEKNENTIHFDAANVMRLNSLVEFAESFRASLKGLDGERSFVRYTHHRDIESVLHDFDEHPSQWPHALADYRSDRALIAMLNVIAQAPSRPSAQAALHLLGHLNITKCSAEWPRSIVSTVRALQDRSGSDAAAVDRALATLAGSLARLVPAANIDAGIHDVLVDLIEDGDARVVANTIEALQTLRKMDPTTRHARMVELDRRLVDSKNTRVAANALVYMGTREISPDVIRRLRKLLESSDVHQAAAGLFAWGEIASHHLSEDLVYFRTQSEFLALEDDFESVVKRHPSITRHAHEARRKAGLRSEAA